MRVIAIDIGGTKIDLGVVDGAASSRAGDISSDHRMIDRLRVATPRGAAEILAACVRGVAELRAAHRDVEAIGVGAPGIIDPATGSVRFASGIVPGWSGAEVRGKLAGATGLPVVVANDVRAAAMGAVDASNSEGRTLLVSIGTGVGGAILENGLLIEGAQGSAGEIAHLATASAGARPCGCGRQHHLEALASGPALAAAIAVETGAPGDLRQIAELLHARDSRAAAIFKVLDRIGSETGETLAGLVTALDFDRVMLTGGALGVSPRLTEAISAGIRSAVWPPERRIDVSSLAHSPDTALVGAARLVLSRFVTQKGLP